MSALVKDTTGPMLLELDHSPTPTPLHTRAGSLDRGVATPHNHEKAKQTVDVLNVLMSHKSSQLPTNVADPLKTDQQELVPVSVVDGSASVSTASKFYNLALYFVFNLGLTLFNKVVMIEFPFPFILTALHATAGVVGSIALSYHDKFTLRPINSRDELALYAFSALYTFNIAISNVSLAMVTVPFHQVIRAITPVFTIAIYRVFFSSTYSSATYFSIIPVILGVGLATYGDYYATTLGFFLTLLGAMLAAVKTVITNRMQTAGFHFSAMELLYRLSPLAVIQSIILAYFYGEFTSFQQYAAEPGHMGKKEVTLLAINAAMAFGLNVTSFTANKKAGALTMTVAANLKQILTVLLSIAFWRLKVHWIGSCGIIMTIFGSMWYSRVEIMGKKHSRPLFSEVLEKRKATGDQQNEV